MTVRELIEFLKRVYNLDDEVAYDIWSAEDVYEQAKSRRITLTSEEANSIIRSIEHYKDANMGIGWGTLDVHIDEIVSERR